MMEVHKTQLRLSSFIRTTSLRLLFLESCSEGTWFRGQEIETKGYPQSVINTCIFLSEQKARWNKIVSQIIMEMMNILKWYKLVWFLARPYSCILVIRNFLSIVVIVLLFGILNSILEFGIVTGQNAQHPEYVVTHSILSGRVLSRTPILTVSKALIMEALEDIGSCYGTYNGLAWYWRPKWVSRYWCSVDIPIFNDMQELGLC